MQTAKKQNLIAASVVASQIYLTTQTIVNVNKFTNNFKKTSNLKFILDDVVKPTTVIQFKTGLKVDSTIKAIALWLCKIQINLVFKFLEKYIIDFVVKKQTEQAWGNFASVFTKLKKKDQSSIFVFFWYSFFTLVCFFVLI